MPYRTRPTEVYAITGRMLLNICHTLSDSYPGLDPEDRLICFAVVVGVAEGRPLAKSKVASYTGLPRTTVLRKLERLIDSGFLEYNEERALIANREKLVGTTPQKVSNRCARIILNAASELSKLDT